MLVAHLINNEIRRVTRDGVVTTVEGNPGSVDGVGTAARFSLPAGIATDSTGNAFVTEHFNETIRKISPSALVTTIAGRAGEFWTADGMGSAARFNTRPAWPPMRVAASTSPIR